MSEEEATKLKIGDVVFYLGTDYRVEAIIGNGSRVKIRKDGLTIAGRRRCSRRVKPDSLHHSPPAPLPMVKQSCGNCRFWERDEVMDSFENGTKECCCRRYPPSHAVPDLDRGGNMYAQPTTHEDEWCGEWREMAP